MSLNYYIDTDYLHSYIFYKNDLLKKFLKNKLLDIECTRYNNFKNILYNSNNNVFIKIPFIVCGEFFNNIKRKPECLNDENSLHTINMEIFSLLNESKVDLVPPKEHCFDIANKLLSDSDLDSTDALIVSQALYDKDSVYMFTLDNKITNSFADGIIDELNTELFEDNQRLQKLRLHE